jgi:pSer/pThr/pTyr-binding forkhead associated (FHA) protein
MSHLIIEQGKDVGQEVSVPAAGMKFGRSPANDLVLDDDSAMLFHGRFFFKSDGSLWVTDFGAGEKTMVGGMPIDEYQLKTGDLVEVGATAFRIINTEQDSTAGQAAPAAATTQSAPDEIDLGFKGSKKVREPSAVEEKDPGKGGSLMHRLMQVLVSLLVLVVLLFVGPELMKIAQDDAPLVEQKQTLAISYERVQADTINIFRYHIEIDEKGNFTINIDDLKNKRHIQKQHQVSDTMMLQLSRSIDDAGFFQIDSDYAGTAQGKYDLYDLTVQRNRRYHHIKVLNRVPPQEIKRTVSVIEDFALSEVGIPFTFFKENAELMLYAEQAYELGAARFAERDVRHGNLAEAIKNFKEAMVYLETFEPKPALYSQAADGLLRANNDRSKRYEEYMFRADRSIRLREWGVARKHLQILSELVPEREDPRYEKISAKLLNVEQHLR